jgi:hypothetical protein
MIDALRTGEYERPIASHSRIDPIVIHIRMRRARKPQHPMSMPGAADSPSSNRPMAFAGCPSDPISRLRSRGRQYVSSFPRPSIALHLGLSAVIPA